MVQVCWRKDWQSQALLEKVQMKMQESFLERRDSYQHVILIRAASRKSGLQ